MIGVNHESSFEAALLRRLPNCEVWGYDYSVAAVCASCASFHFIADLSLTYLVA